MARVAGIGPALGAALPSRPSISPRCRSRTNERGAGLTVRILIIDDDPDLRALLAHYIKQRWADWVVDEYDPLEHNFPGADFPLGSYQTVILDYMLGRGDGLEWLQRLKERGDCPKILFLTGSGNEIIAVRAMKAGANDYQRKQELSREKLITSLQELTAGAQDKTVSAEF